MTDPFTDFAVDTGLLRMELARTYSSDDWAYAGGAIGIFGRGWHHNWEAWLSCSGGTCSVARGSLAGWVFRFSHTTPSLDGSEAWDVYSAISNAPQSAHNRNVLVRRPGGEWTLFLTDGRQLDFASACDACSDPASDPFCQDPTLGGKARLVKVVNQRGNAVEVTYDRPAGVLLRLSDDLGHRLEVQGAAACTDGLASGLSFDGMGVASYSFQGNDLISATDAEGSVLRSYHYDSARTGRLLAVMNEAGEAIAEFSYDAAARAIGLVDRSSSIAVDYDAPDGIRVTEYFGDTSATSVRTLDSFGNATSISDGCACGPARTLTWNGRRLTCSADAQGHVTWQKIDGQGRVVYRAEYAGSECTTSPSALDPATSRQEWTEYGLWKPLATRLFMLLDAAIATSSSMPYVSSSYVGETVSHDPTPQSMDPAGYACQESALPVGSVVCRRVTGGYTYDAAGSRVFERHATFYSYDGRGRLKRTIGPINVDRPSPQDVAPLEERTYWPDGEVLSRRGRLKQVSRYASSTATLTTSYDYDAFGVYRLTQPNGLATTIGKDGRGRPTSVLTSDGAIRRTRFHDGLDPRLQLLPSGAAVRFGYDSRGRLASVEHLSSDPEAVPATATLGWGEYFSYDVAGNRVRAERRDGAGVVTWRQDREYDVQHRVVSEANPASPGTSRANAYDASGFLSTTTDEVGRATAFTPDALGRVARVRRTGVDAAGTPQGLDMAQYTYQPYVGTLSEVTDANGQRTTYAYDDFGRISSLTNPNLGGGQVRFEHDARGNVRRRKDSYLTVAYTYDGLDRVLTSTASNTADGSSISYGYTYDEAGAQGMLTSILEPDRVVRYGYDARGRLTSETIEENGVSFPLTTGYAYGPDGAVTDITYPSGLHVQLGLDPATGEPLQVKNAADGALYADAIGHVPGGPVQGLVFGNGLTLTRSFNLRYEPQAITSGPVALAYGLTAAGDVESVTGGGASASVGYDFLDRLTGSPGSFEYEYDGNGNRTREIVQGTGGWFSYGSDRVASKALGPPQPPPAYEGCYTDQSARALPVQLMSSGATIETCVASAQAKGLKYAGLQYASYCFGGNALQYAKVADSDCNMPCSANTAQKCGGSWRNSIYAVPTTPIPPLALSFGYDRQGNVSALAAPPPPSSQPPSPPPYYGCYADGGTRALPVLLMSSGATVESCVAAAHAQKLKYAGLQYYGYCFGGDELLYAKVSEAECNTKCTANSSQTCGGGWRNSIYGTTPPAPAVCLRHDPLGRLVLFGSTSASGIAPGGTACISDSSVTQALARFKYDARGRRIARWSSATSGWTYVVSDGAGNPLSEVALVSGAWTKVRDYVWLEGKPLAQIEYPGPAGSAQGYAYYFHLDHIGLPRALTNQAQQTVWSASARPFGDVVETTGTDPLSGRTVVTNLRLPGQYDERLLGSLGLQGPYYNWNRWYLPGVGRYLELDPLALRGGWNTRYGVDWYGYAFQNPLTWTDPRGEQPICGGKCDLNQCLNACKASGEALRNFCRGLPDPRLRAGCWALEFSSEVACNGWCYWNCT